MNENGENQYDILEPGDIWFFPKGVAHGVQGLDDENEVRRSSKASSNQVLIPLVLARLRRRGL